MSVVVPANSRPLQQNDTAMRYRPFGKTGYYISALSMGCMRLGEDQDRNTRLINSAIDSGINYFETTRYYLGGQCQHRVAPGLKGKSPDIIVSGKDGIDPDKTAAQFRREIERQLEILGLTHFKFYQVGWFRWEMMPHLLKRGGVLEAIRRAQDEGLIKFLGFTGHDTPANFIKCIETGLFDSITIPYNMLNRTYEPLIARAAELGIGVVAMCPVGGGMLGFPDDDLRAQIGYDVPTVEMALQFVLANPGISTACSGMSNLEMLDQDVRTVRNFDPAKFSTANICAALDRFRSQLGDQFCTWCRYCMDCPSGVDIPWHLHVHNYWKGFGLKGWAKAELAKIPEAKRASKCTNCGVCETKCPNKLPIRQMLKNLKEVS